MCTKDKAKGNYSNENYEKIKWEEIIRSNIPLIIVSEGEKCMSKKQYMKIKAKSHSSALREAKK